MDNFGLLSKEDSALVIEVLEASLRINKREQFFSWLQGAMQSLIPHEILICATTLKTQSNRHFETFSTTRYLTDDHIRAATNNENGLVARMISAWKRHPRPILISDSLSEMSSTSFHVPFKESKDVLIKLELKNALAHGISNKEGDVLSFFSFSRINGEPNPRHAYLMEFLVPHMHNALLRVINESRSSSNKSASVIDESYSVSARELEVLYWVGLGKTNPEISVILNISINTVKNHVHSSILKLGVENRVQASSLATKLGLIDLS
jgi:transcriptional regulator EpsA